MMSGLLPPLSSRTSTMSHPTCCCSASLDRCDRCDLLVGLEGFHLMSVARTQMLWYLMLSRATSWRGARVAG